MVQEGVDQSASVVSMRGMGYHSRRFIDDEKVIVLEENVERDILRSCVLRRRFGEGDVNDLTGLHQVAGACRLAVNENKSVLNSTLDFVAGGIFNLACKKEIEALFLFSGWDDYVVFEGHPCGQRGLSLFGR